MTIDTTLALRTVRPEKLSVSLAAVATDDRHARHREYARGGIPFALWLALTDQRITRRTGLSLFDLPDATFADWFEDGITPAEAAVLVLDAGSEF